MELGVEFTVEPATGEVLTSEFALAGPANKAVAIKANREQASAFLNFIPQEWHNSPPPSHFFRLGPIAPCGGPLRVGEDAKCPHINTHAAPANTSLRSSKPLAIRH